MSRHGQKRASQSSICHGPAPHPARTRPGRPSLMELALGPACLAGGERPGALRAPRPPPAGATRKRSGEFRTITTRLPRRIDCLPRRIDREWIWLVGMWGLAGKRGSAILRIPFPSSRAAGGGDHRVDFDGEGAESRSRGYVIRPRALHYHRAYPCCKMSLQSRGCHKAIFLFFFIYGIVNLEP